MSAGDKPHGILEDIGAEIGFTAACAFVDWFGGTTVYIPEQPTEGHAIERVIGPRAFARLCRFADDLDARIINVPLDYQRELTRRDRLICALIAKGVGTKEVARVALISERQVQNIRRRLEADGLLPLVLKQGDSVIAAESICDA